MPRSHPRQVERLVLVSPMAPVKTPFWNERMAKMSALRGEAASARRAEMLAKLPNATDEETRALCRELNDDVFRLYFHDPTPEKLAHAALRCEIPPAAIRNRPVVEAATLGSLGDWDFRPRLEQIDGARAGHGRAAEQRPPRCHPGVGGGHAERTASS